MTSAITNTFAKNITRWETPGGNISIRGMFGNLLSSYSSTGINASPFTIETINTDSSLSSGIFTSSVNSMTGTRIVNLPNGENGMVKNINTSFQRTSPVIVNVDTGGTYQLGPSRPTSTLLYNNSWALTNTSDGVLSFYPTKKDIDLVGSGSFNNIVSQGTSVSLSDDGNTLAIGGPGDHSNIGATWIFTRSGTWSQQGNKLIGTGVTGTSGQGSSCALSADGNTLAIGGPLDNSFIGATWIFTRSGTTWTQQGDKLIGTGVTGTSKQGYSCSLSSDGNTLAVGGITDSSDNGAVWIFTRSNGLWSQQTKISGNTSSSAGFSCSLSSDGNTLAIGSPNDNSLAGSTSIYTRSGGIWTQQTILVGTGAIGTSSEQGFSCSLSADGNTLATGGPFDDTVIGATWIFTRSGTTWTQQSKLIGTGNIGGSTQGMSCALTADGNTLISNGPSDNSSLGATWVFTRSGTTWTQQSKLVSGIVFQGLSCDLSSNGNTLALGCPDDNGSIGSTLIYV